MIALRKSRKFHRKRKQFDGSRLQLIAGELSMQGIIALCPVRTRF